MVKPYFIIPALPVKYAKSFGPLVEQRRKKLRLSPYTPYW